MGIERETAILGQDDSYFKQLPRMLQLKRDEMYAALKDVGMSPIIPQGGYFMLANISELGSLLIINHAIMYICALTMEQLGSGQSQIQY